MKNLVGVSSEQCALRQGGYALHLISCRRRRWHLAVTCDLPTGRRDVDPCDETAQWHNILVYCS